MEFLKKITNANLKKLLKKKYLTEESVREIKTSFFIHPSTPEEDNLYSFNYADHDGCKVIELFTSLEEYNQVYGNNDDVVPLPWYFDQFKHSFDEDTRGILINPSSDNIFISNWVSFLIMDDMEEVERTIKFNNREVEPDGLKDLEPGLDYLDEYLSNKSKITYIDRLFDILKDSIVYVLYEYDESQDDFLKDGMIFNEDVQFRYFKRDSYIMVFTDKDNFKDFMNSKHYYYGIADLIEVIKTVFELDYNGIILKAPENEFILARHRLLKYWDRIVENYRHIDIASKYAFKVEGDFDERI